jgi:hypothetical protein
MIQEVKWSGRVDSRERVICTWRLRVQLSTSRSAQGVAEYLSSESSLQRKCPAVGLELRDLELNSLGLDRATQNSTQILMINRLTKEVGGAILHGSDDALRSRRCPVIQNRLQTIAGFRQLLRP